MFAAVRCDGHSVRGESRAVVGVGKGGARLRRAGPGRPAAVYRAISLPAFAGSRGGFVVVWLGPFVRRSSVRVVFFLCSFLLDRVNTLFCSRTAVRVCAFFFVLNRVRLETCFSLAPFVRFFYLSCRCARRCVSACSGDKV